jgi:hypothetical protein
VNIPGRRRPEGDEGSFTFAVLIWIFIFFVFMSVVIDGSMEISAKEQAANIADSIARNVADDINTAGLNSGQIVINTVTVNGNRTSACRPTDESAITGSYDMNNIRVLACTVTGDSVTVTVGIAYTPLFMGTQGNATASATATAVNKPTI